MSLGAEAWWAAMMGADQFEDGFLEFEDDTLDVNGGSTVNLRVKLGARPRSDVTVALSEASALISLGTDSLTFTPANWDDYQSVVVTAAGNRDVLTLASNGYVETATQVQWSYGIPGRLRPQITAGLVPSGSRYLAQFEAYAGGNVHLAIAAAETGGHPSGDDLTDLFETDGSFTITSAGHSLDVSMAGADLTDPYFFTPSNSAEVTAFYTAVFAETGNQAATLTLRDYTPGDATISLSASGPDEYAGVTDSATVTVN